MKIFVGGAVHGRLADFYRKIEETEQLTGVKADWVLQTGNFGVWPDPKRMDRASRKHVDSDFHEFIGKGVPRPTVFVPGKHEDHRWLRYKASYGGMEIIRGLHLLLNGYSTVIGDETTQLSIVGLGKSYSPAVYNHQKAMPYNKKLSHYTRNDVALAQSHDRADILLTHEARKDVMIGPHKSEAEGIDLILNKIQPKIHFHGHFNTSDFYLTPTPTYALSFGEIRAFDYSDGKFKILA